MSVQRKRGKLKTIKMFECTVRNNTAIMSFQASWFSILKAKYTVFIPKTENIETTWETVTSMR